MSLSVAEVWTLGVGGRLERTVSVPDRGPSNLTLGSEEETVVARAGVSGVAWARIWLPAIIRSDDEVLRVAPITNSGELLGLIVVRRPDGALTFDENDDQVLTELARQVGLALHNVKLDSALQESLDEVRRQADELRASRARIVEAGDAERRRIERDLHDGAQQHLVALAVSVNLVRQIAETDPDTAQSMLAQIGTDLQEAVQELRNLAHGIYPPLLMDRGLAEALSAAAGPRRAPDRRRGRRHRALPAGRRGGGLLLLPGGTAERGQARGRRRAGDDHRPRGRGRPAVRGARRRRRLRPRHRRAPRPRLREHERPRRRDRRLASTWSRRRAWARRSEDASRSPTSSTPDRSPPTPCAARGCGRRPGREDRGHDRDEGGGDEHRAGDDHQRAGLDARHRRDALPVGEGAPHDAADRHAERQSDDERERGEGQRLGGDGARHLAPQEPERLEDRELVTAPADGGEQRVHEH